MIKSKTSAQEIEEIEEHNNRRQKEGGYKLMSVRDRGYKRLSNGVLMHWNHPPREHAPGFSGISVTTHPKARPGEFVLEMGNEKVTFDAEEFRKFLRWV